jgi:5-amino-6-(5-phosphoribosylamino)uracil reductase
MARTDRPYVLLSCVMSMDGCIDDTTDRRLVLSDEEDLDRVDAVRATCDAIMVGANTIRKDDPRLLLRSPERVRARMTRRLPPNPAKITLTATGNLDPNARFFTDGSADRLVFTPTNAHSAVAERLDGIATILPSGDPLDLSVLLGVLTGRGITRLMVEGGTSLVTAFLAEGLADELHLVVAPFLVGDPGAPRLVGATGPVHGPEHPARLIETRRIGEQVLLRYALSDRC